MRLIIKNIYFLLVVISFSFLFTSCFFVRCENTPPVAVLKVNPIAGYAPLAVVVDLSNSYDPDGFIVRYTLDFGDGSLPATGTDLTNPVYHVYSGAGSFTVILTVTDNLGATATASEVIRVLPPNNSPIATITSPADNSIFPQGDVITFSGNGFDPEDGPLTGASLIWVSNIDGQIGIGDSFSRNDLSIGTHTITLRAIDSQGATGSASIQVIVGPRGLYVDDDVRECPNAHFTKIQDAVDFSREGDTVIVCPGTYIEHVKVNKSLLTILSIRGADCTIVQPSGYGPIFEVTANSVTISGFTIRYSKDDAGIKLKTSNNHTIANNAIYSNVFGIRAWNSHNNTITNNYIARNMYGIALDTSHNNILTKNTMENDGIVIAGVGTPSNVIDETNTVNGKPVYYWQNVNGGKVPGGAGQIILVKCRNVEISHQNISNTDIGIHLIESHDNIIANNIVTSNDITGIWLSYSHRNVVTGNLLNDNGWHGLYVWASSNNEIVNNTISSNHWFGIRLLFQSAGNIIYLNDFINNNIQAYEQQSNLWNSTKPIAYTYNGMQFVNYLGNYWSDYIGDDGDGDGIGDIPYKIDSNQDNYPLMESFNKYILHQ